ncbi:MAG TPA: DUF4340 domain-containing protein [Burkholderiales bacterium]
MADAPAKNPLARRWWLNLALLAVIAGLGGYAWYRSGQSPEAAKPTLTSVAAASVQRIEIVRPNEETVRLERRDGRWRLTAPLAARADEFAVEQLMRVLRAPIDATVKPAEGGLARYGLESPRLTVRFDDTELRFGEFHPLKNEYYVQDGAEVRLIGSQYYAHLAVPYTNLIDSRLLGPEVKPVGFKLPGFALTLRDGEWQREPRIEALSSDRINGFVDDWRHARALKVEKYSGKKPQAQVVIAAEGPDGEQSEITVAVLAREPELVLYRADEGLEYHFPQDTAKRLLELDAPAKSDE